MYCYNKGLNEKPTHFNTHKILLSSDFLSFSKNVFIGPLFIQLKINGFLNFNVISGPIYFTLRIISQRELVLPFLFLLFLLELPNVYVSHNIAIFTLFICNTLVIDRCYR